MSHLDRRVFSLLGFVVAMALSARASTPVRWQTSTLNELVRGEVENLSIDSTGRLTLGPSTDLTSETTAPYLWSLLAAADGSLYVGSGNEGKVFRVDAAGRLSVFFDAAELEVHAVALAPDGGPLRGHRPGGPDLQAGSKRRREAVLRSGGQVHLEPCRRRVRHGVRGNRRAGRHLQDRA